ncbi:MAG TPA: ABC transporter ATP-binding protein [Geobacteraceae bacterium]|nr:ABC transporter ATP-binding protein [Geobacteraceae bacterium]
MEPLYRLKNLRKSYGSREVLAIEDLSIREGGIYTLTGPNGSGKSTLLGILAFLSPPTTGEVLFAGESVAWNSRSLLSLRRNATLLHQAPYLFDTSVRGNITFGLKTRGLTAGEQQRRVAEALEMVDLVGFEKRKARELSGGEVQRVALARALALKPRVLLLDEPLANVDRKCAELLVEVIISLPARGTSVIVSTHDPAHRHRFGGNRIHLVAGRPAVPPHHAHGPGLTEPEAG